MSDHVLFDELHLSFHVPKHLDHIACDSIRRIVQSRPFRIALRRAIRRVVRQDSALDPVRIGISV